MPLLPTDLTIIERDGVPYRATVGDMIEMADQVEPWFMRRLAAPQTMGNNTSAQDWFATAPGFNLAADSLYEFEGVLYSVNGATSHGLNLSFAAITGATIKWQHIGAKAAVNSQATALRMGWSDTFATGRLATTESTVTGNVVRVRGEVVTDTAGVLRPLVAQSAASGSFSLHAGTMMRVRRLGPAALENSGGWA
jgi:hypothetical protein